MQSILYSLYYCWQADRYADYAAIVMNNPSALVDCLLNTLNFLSGFGSRNQGLCIVVQFVHSRYKVVSPNVLYVLQLWAVR